ncbi:MAG: substrate-binding domain-containing protein, partial [Paraglaciecola chathamensis]
RRVGLIWVDDQRGSLRLAACERHLLDTGIEVTSVQRINPPVSVGEGRKAMQQLIDEDNIPSGVICSNDLITLGAVSALQASQINVPEQVALIGFGDIDFAAHVSPSLSTFQVQSAEIGKTAAAMLLARIEKGADRGSLKENLGFQFEDRETS